MKSFHSLKTEMTVSKKSFRSKVFTAGFFSLCILSSCNETNDISVTNISEQITPPDTSIQLEEATTAVDVSRYPYLKDPFFLDSVDYSDTLVYSDTAYFPETTFHLTAYYPQSKSAKHKKWNTRIRTIVDEYLLSYKKPDDHFLTVSAEIWLTEFEMTKDFVSVLFNHQDYYWGAAHYNHGYISLNYDLANETEIKLTDLLIFDDESDKQKFCDAINPDPTTSINEMFLGVEDFAPERDYTVVYDALTLWFDDYDKGPSWKSYYLPHHKFRGYVAEKYRYIFELTFR